MQKIYANILVVTAFLLLLGACQHTGSPVSSPDTITEPEITSKLRTIGGVRRFAKPNGEPLNVAPDGMQMDGTVVAHCVITEEGIVEQCKVVENPFASPNEDFIAVLQAQRFAPIEFDGQPQRVNYTFRTEFSGDDYFNDFLKICRVYDNLDISPDLGPLAASQWLLDKVKTNEAQRRLTELSEANKFEWFQLFRRDATLIGIPKCPFAIHWQESLNKPAANTKTP